MNKARWAFVFLCVMALPLMFFSPQKIAATVFQYVNINSMPPITFATTMPVTVKSVPTDGTGYLPVHPTALPTLSVACVSPTCPTPIPYATLAGVLAVAPTALPTTFTVVPGSGVPWEADIYSIGGTALAAGGPIPVSFSTAQPVVFGGVAQTQSCNSSGNQCTTGVGIKTSSQSVSVTAASDSIWENDLKTINGSAFALGQTTKSASIPVTIASDQGNIGISGTVTATSDQTTPGTTDLEHAKVCDTTTPTTCGKVGTPSSTYSIGNALSVASSSLYFDNGNSTYRRVSGDNYNLGPQWTSGGGSSTTAIGAGTAGPTVIKNSAGRLARILVTTAGTTGTETFYDNASACSGTVIGIVPGTTVVSTFTAGDTILVDMPAASGITACGGTGSPAVTVSSF